jgi:hypothetical protein
MKKFLLLLCLTLSVVACSKEDSNKEEAIIVNNPLPKEPQELKILAIGNSFTEDATQFLPSILCAAHVKHVIIGRLLGGGLSLQNHWEFYSKDSAAYVFQKSDSSKFCWNKVENNYSITKALASENWDIIVLQQVSYMAGKYESYQPYLNNLVKTLHNISTNPKVCLAWQMTWAYAKNSTSPNFAYYNNDQLTMYNAITNATQQMVKGSGIDVIIPSGTTIQNLRNTSLKNSTSDLTRDGIHSNLVVGRYALACTWYLSLIKPCLSSYTIEGYEYRPTEDNEIMSNDKIQLIWKAAKKAVQNPYAISDLN